MKHSQPMSIFEIGVAMATGAISALAIVLLGLMDVLTLPLFLSVLAGGGLLSALASLMASRTVGVLYYGMDYHLMKEAAEDAKVAARAAKRTEAEARTLARLEKRYEKTRLTQAADEAASAAEAMEIAREKLEEAAEAVPEVEEESEIESD